jgi:hypothetical protein
MSTLWIVALVVWGIGLAFVVYSIITAEPYPEEFERADNEKMLKEFNEHKKRDN